MVLLFQIHCYTGILLNLSFFPLSFNAPAFSLTMNNFLNILHTDVVVWTPSYILLSLFYSMYIRFMLSLWGGGGGGVGPKLYTTANVFFPFSVQNYSLYRYTFFPALFCPIFLHSFCLHGLFL